MRCLAVTYFHMGIHTIIGAESFHGPVRDGKAWDQLAMAARLKLYKSSSRLNSIQIRFLIFKSTKVMMYRLKTYISFFYSSDLKSFK